jgi:hypothetical protein
LNIGTTAIVALAFVLAENAVPATASQAASAIGSGGSPEEAATGPGVVVNEFVPGTYVELHNNSPSTVDISGFTLWLCGPDAVADEVRLGMGRTLASGDFYVVASSSFTGAPADQIYRGVLPGSGAVLLDPDDAWTDGAAVVANSPCGEGAPAPVCAQAATARDAYSTDTGSNAADFACRTRSPGGLNPVAVIASRDGRPGLRPGSEWWHRAARGCVRPGGRPCACWCAGCGRSPRP